MFAQACARFANCAPTLNSRIARITSDWVSNAAGHNETPPGFRGSLNAQSALGAIRASASAGRTYGTTAHNAGTCWSRRSRNSNPHRPRYACHLTPIKRAGVRSFFSECPPARQRRVIAISSRFDSQTRFMAKQIVSGCAVIQSRTFTSFWPVGCPAKTEYGSQEPDYCPEPAAAAILATIALSSGCPHMLSTES